ncbi:MAG: hypothetical protein MI810_08230 [Flavobacteriales bacterium]|nr:hypothetical protein [Flavobacteriales bacterium]
MKTAIVILRVFLGLMGAMLLFQGFMWSFLPETNLEMNGITTDSILGINMIKSDIGGALLTAGTFLGLFALQGRKWFYPTVIVAGGYFMVRTVSLFMDGSHPTIIIGIVIEAVVIVTSVILNNLLRARDHENV